MDNNLQQVNLKLMIDSNDLNDLAKVTKLIREGWDLLHFSKSESEKVGARNIKVVFNRNI